LIAFLCPHWRRDQAGASELLANCLLAGARCAKGRRGEEAGLLRTKMMKMSNALRMPTWFDICAAKRQSVVPRTVKGRRARGQLWPGAHRLSSLSLSRTQSVWLARVRSPYLFCLADRLVFAGAEDLDRGCGTIRVVRRHRVPSAGGRNSTAPPRHTQLCPCGAAKGILMAPERLLSSNPGLKPTPLQISNL